MLYLEFFPPNAPERKVTVEISCPVPKGDAWASTVKFSGALTKSIEVMQVDGVRALYDCFKLARLEITALDPVYMHDGRWDVEGVLPETIPWEYGSDIYAQVKTLADRLVAEEEEKRTVQTLAWMRRNPDWVKKNRHLLSEELLNRLADEDG